MRSGTGTQEDEVASSFLNIHFILCRVDWFADINGKREKDKTSVA
jgi:hypothetical protein